MRNQNPCIPKNLPVENLDWNNLIEPLSQAERELGRFDGTLKSIPNQGVLLSPLITNEAVLSSRIEGTQVSLTEALEYESGGKQDGDKQADIREVINYRIALVGAAELLGKNENNITFSLIRQLHARLMQDVRGGDQNPGAFRTVQNWIGAKGDPIENARFIPPDPMIMQDYLDNWGKFINSGYKSPLVQLALMHAQFEIIHPFNDGNGRLGRMIIPLFLYQKSILQNPVFYISEYMHDHDKEYRDRLLAITEADDWMGWVIFFLTALSAQAQSNNDKAQKILKLYNKMKEAFRAVTHSQYAQPALDAFFNQPILNSTRFIQLSKIKHRSTANTILKKLEGEKLIKLLIPASGQNPTIYMFKRLIDVAEGRE